MNLLDSMSWIIGAGALVVGLAGGYFLRLWFIAKKFSGLEQKAAERLNKAETEAKELLVEAKEKAASFLSDIQKEERERKQEIRRLEDHILKKEEALQRERDEFNRKLRDMENRTTETQKIRQELSEREKQVMRELERTAQLTAAQAKQELIQNLQRQESAELREEVIKMENEKRAQIEERALDIMVQAIQRCAHDKVGDATTSVVEIPNDELKGKIIGREGRNIRSLERMTGVEVIVDETPESIILSSYDPYRRELAKMALQKLIKDGRIQPAKIEEKVHEAEAELEERVKKLGEEAAYEVGIVDLPKDLLNILGRLHFRTSYGQNVLDHSIEMTHVAVLIATELGMKKLEVIKKAALLHDIGKAIDHEVEGTHVEIGRKLLKKYGIAEEVVRGMEAHHEEYPYSTPESYIVAAADAISAARPGARRDTLEKYIKRLEEMERLVKEFDGVEKVYAVSAGREVRVFVVPEKIDDFAAFQMAKQIAAKIQTDLHYPGEVKVTVIREVRAVEVAK